MTVYLSFLIDKESIGIKYSDKYQLTQTLINKVFLGDDGEYIQYKNKRVPVYDTSLLIGKEKLKKFDGLLFIDFGDKIIALKTEGFYKDLDTVNVELNPLDI